LPTSPPVSPGRIKGVPFHVRVAELIGLGPQWAADLCLVVCLIMAALVIGCLWKMFGVIDRVAWKIDSAKHDIP